MVHLTVSLRALVFVLLFGVVLFTGSDVVRGAPSSADGNFDNLNLGGNINFNNPGPNGGRDIHTLGNTGGVRIFADTTLTNPPNTAALQFFGNGHTAFPGQAFIDSGSNTNAAILFRTAAAGGVAERMRVSADGNVGIGTSSPAVGLDVEKALDITNGKFGSKWPLYTISNYPTLGMNLYYANGAFRLGKGSSNNFGGAIQMDPVNGTMTFYVSQLGNADGAVTVSERLRIGAGGSAFEVRDGGGGTSLRVANFGSTTIKTPVANAMTHACWNTSSASEREFANCSSAAEHVPTIDAGRGAPQVGDLVSIAPTLANPNGDAHSPFVVTRSASACDPNLLGFLLDPESGADGPKVDDTYLPLAIYGYFPARVTMENGAIHRGDAITSSSTPGAGMKATGACKTIGYALEDANEDGLVQVFANSGESSAAEVSALREEIGSLQGTVNDLQQANAAKDAELAALNARLVAIEKQLGGGAVPLVATR